MPAGVVVSLDPPSGRQVPRDSTVKVTVSKGPDRVQVPALGGMTLDQAEAALRFAEPVLVRTAQKGIVHAKTASRKVSRFTKRVKAMQA